MVNVPWSLSVTIKPAVNVEIMAQLHRLEPRQRGLDRETVNGPRAPGRQGGAAGNMRVLFSIFWRRLQQGEGAVGVRLGDLRGVAEHVTGM